MGKQFSIINDGVLEKFDERDLYGFGKYDVPENVNEIGALAFNGCQELTSVYIPDSVDTIKVAAFANCTSLTKVRFPNRVYIEDYAFAGCIYLNNVEMPKIADVAEHAFKGCPPSINNNSVSALNKLEDTSNKVTLADQLMTRNRKEINIGIVGTPVSQYDALEK